MKKYNPRQNFEETREDIGYVERKNATQADYDKIGFTSGLEVHQQVKTKHKLFCHCPAGIFQKADEYDAEIIRHMRPTLSELGEYDGTALMEFKTRKEIVYHISNRSACTYEVDDTPPFKIDREGLQNALILALTSKMNIVGEVHITRKQYLDGSIPTGFQRTAILGTEGELQLKHKKVRLIQLSIEEDACREVSDIGHRRVYRTDRLGMPLIETVTYPELQNPDELKECCDYIRFLNRSTGLVRTGIGAGREDVNVSCKGGTRIEIKGVAHTKWIPELSHNECYRQLALLSIQKQLNKRIKKDDWKMQAVELNPKDYKFYYTPLKDALTAGQKLYAVNLPQFFGLLSHFTQPNKPFYTEFAYRLKVVACIEYPNMTTSEDLDDVVSDSVFEKIQKMMKADENDAQIIFWAPEADVKTALETIEERAMMAFDGIPKETRKSLPDGTTIFERVLPGADRMYPDTDSAPIPLESAYIDSLQQYVPDEVHQRYLQLIKWKVPEDCHKYLFTHNYFPLIQKMVKSLKLDPRYVSCFIGHRVKHLHGVYRTMPFDMNRLFDMFDFILKSKLDISIASKLLEQLFAAPEESFKELLKATGFKKITVEQLLTKANKAADEFLPKRKDTDRHDKVNFMLGQIHYMGMGNVDFKDLSKKCK